MNDYEIHLVDILPRDDLARYFRSRNSPYVFKKSSPVNIQEEVDNGWEIIGPKKRKTLRLRKRKDIGQEFQDSVWCIFYKMGFSELNRSNEFAIPRIGSDIGKRIDIFAKDDNCICLIECKASEQPHTKRSLGTAIDQYAAIHKDLESSIRSHYRNKGDKTKYRFRWLLALKNIDLNDNDYIRAKKANIMVVDDHMIQYYSELSKHFGPASRYQFFADLYPRMAIPEMIEPVPAIRGITKNSLYRSSE